MDGTALLDDPAARSACRLDSLPGSSHLRSLLDAVPAGLLSFSADLRPHYVGATVLALLDIADGGFATLPALLAAARALTPDGIRQAQRFCAAVAAGAEPPTTPVLLSGTEDRCFSLAAQPLADGTWLLTFEEVTARRAAEADAQEEAQRDPLTGLRNRKIFQDRVAEALRQGGGGALDALMMIDLDRFKSVNDTLGHPIGDGLLQLVGKRLRSLARSSDVAARLGGDEFALLARSLPDRAAAAALAGRIVDLLGRPYLVDGHLVNVGASVGVAMLPEDGADMRSAFKHADLALYHSKGQGRSLWSFFDSGMDVRAAARRSLEIDLRKALALAEFELHYQPQVELETRRVVGFEALVRWRHPERGLVPPGDFIALAEEIGLIVPLGEWVLRQACRDALSWPSTLSVAVNVSPYQFEDACRLTQVVSHTLATTGLPGRRLEVEVTESVLLRNEVAVLAALHRLRDMGVRVAMDDFGTGYSSLSQLHSFPFDKIKIDRSFIRDTEDVVGQNAIIRAITALGASLGMSTIAEGVETPDQLARIRSEGCGSVQGYLFSRPVPLQEIAGFLAGFESSHGAATRLPDAIPSGGMEE